MKKRYKNSRVFTLLVVALLLLIPGIGTLAAGLGILPMTACQFNAAELDGFWTKHPMPKIRLRKLVTGEFQQQLDEWFASNFCARNLLVRLNNEILYSVFSKSYMFQNRIVVGKEDVLYQIDYVKSYFHKRTCAEEQQIDSLVAELKELQKELHRRKIAFVYVITPSKVTICPDNLPSTDMKPQLDGVYGALSNNLRRNGICFVDGHAITARLKLEKSLQTFSKGGAHWTEVAACATLNEMISRINEQIDLKIPQIAPRDFNYGPPVGIEKDLASLMNLMNPRFDYQVEHAHFFPTKSQWRSRGKIVFEGTSFVGQLTSVLDQAHTFALMRHYFYYTDNMYVFPTGAGTGPIKDESINWERDILNANAIVVENNEGLNLEHNIRFVRDALLHIKGNGLASKASAGVI